MRADCIYCLLAVVVLAGRATGQTCTMQWGNLTPTPNLNGIVHALTVHDEDATGPKRQSLYLGGTFLNAGGLSASRIARWDGAAWYALGLGITGASVFSLQEYDEDGTGPNKAQLFVGGNFTQAGGFEAYNIARWNGTGWTAVGIGLNGPAYAMVVYDEDGTGPQKPNLIVGGLFTLAGGSPANRIARWNGSAWSALGDGLNGYCAALTVFDEDGTGPQKPNLFAGGGFTVAGAGIASHVARWNGSAWSSLVVFPNPDGVDGTVYTLLAADDDGSGARPTALFVGGAFSSAGGIAASNIARWTGTQWTTVGAGLNAPPFAMSVFDPDGSGSQQPALYVAGSFTQAGGTSANRVARWNGSTWAGLDTGTNGEVRATAVYDDDGTGSNLSGLYTGGQFTLAGTRTVSNLARWMCLPPEGRPGDLNCDNVVNFNDIDPFVLALSGPAGYQAAYPNCRYLNADCNNDGLVNFNDIDAFVALLSGG